MTSFKSGLSLFQTQFTSKNLGDPSSLLHIKILFFVDLHFSHLVNSFLREKYDNMKRFSL